MVRSKSLVPIKHSRVTVTFLEMFLITILLTLTTKWTPKCQNLIDCFSWKGQKSFHTYHETSMCDKDVEKYLRAYPMATLFANVMNKSVASVITFQIFVRTFCF